MQAFVEPRDHYNNAIYVDWSRTHCIIERRYSKVKLLDKRYSVQQRGSTFEKLEGVTDKVNVTSKAILDSINQEIYQLCDYIKENSPKNYDVTNIKVMMKIDGRGQLNLLWAPYIQATKMDHPRRIRKKHHKFREITDTGKSNYTRGSLTHRSNSTMTTYKTSKI